MAALRARTSWGVAMAMLAIAASASATAESAMPTFTPVPEASARVGPTPNLGKCINLANTLEPPNEGDWGPAFRDEDARIIGSAGFSTVRLPVNFLGHASAAAPYTLDARFMRRVRHVIDALRGSGLNVIVDQHNNEDLSAAPNANLLATLAPSLAAIRETNPIRVVVIGGERWSGVDSLASLTLPDDPNVVPTVHYYDPFEFTHQGASFIHPAPPFGRSFGGAADAAQLQDSLAKIRAYMARTGRVPFVGEYGAIETIPLEQRISYYRTATAAFASVGLASCAWGYRNAFPLWKNGRWLPGMVEAIAAPE